MTELIENKFGVKHNRHYVIALLRGWGYSFQKAEHTSDHLDEAKRQEWLLTIWPSLLQTAKDTGGLISFGDEASFAQWGSRAYSWARLGQTPVVKTSGKRKSYKFRTFAH